MKQPDVLIIGAGMAGLACGRLLQAQGLSVQLIEKSRGVGGRLSTRRATESLSFDHGAQFLTAQNHSFKGVLHQWFGLELIRPWFTQMMHVTPGQPSELLDENITRYVGQSGMNDMLKYLGRHLDLVPNQRVIRVEQSRNGWLAYTESGETHEAPLILITCPLPQTLTILTDSQLPLTNAEQHELTSVQYETCLTIMLQLDGPSDIQEPGGFRPATGCEPIGWIADNYVKGVTKVPGSLTIQAGPEYSQTHLEDDKEKVFKDLLKAARPYIGDRSVEQWWWHRWRYAYPLSTLPSEFYTLEHCPGLYLAGDSFGAERRNRSLAQAKGLLSQQAFDRMFCRVETAALSGMAVADAIVKDLEGQHLREQVASS